MIYHAHIYWKNSDQKNIAMAQRTLLNQLNCGVGMIYDEIIGPHPLPMYEVNYFDDNQEQVENLLAKTGLSILLHENTGDHLRDHTQGARWLGEKLSLNLKWLKRYTEGKWTKL
jgi:DOPA 4,5-dioxygenase